MKLCECGCGQEIVKQPHHKRFGTPRFILGHNSKGKTNPMYGVRLTGENNSHWNGGKTQSEGYIYIRKPEHPFCNQRGYVAEHRLVVEKQIGRYLQRTESVHHLEKKDNNQAHLLMAFISQSAHKRFEMGGSVKPEEIIYDGRNQL